MEKEAMTARNTPSAVSEERVRELAVTHFGVDFVPKPDEWRDIQTCLEEYLRLRAEVEAIIDAARAENARGEGGPDNVRERYAPSGPRDGLLPPAIVYAGHEPWCAIGLPNAECNCK